MASILAVSAYGRLNVRVRASIGDLLSTASMATLSASPDLASLAQSLNTTVYGSYLHQQELSNPQARTLSYALQKRIPEKYWLFMQNAPDQSTKLIDLLFRYYEKDNLKTVLRGIREGADWSVLSYMLNPMGNFSALNFEQMYASHSIEDASRQVRNSLYGASLRVAAPRCRHENSLFPAEALLDLDYWKLVWEQVKALPSSDRVVAEKLIGLIIERNDLVWASRYKFLHNFSEAQIINYTLGLAPRVGTDVIRRIAGGAYLRDIVLELYPSLASDLPGKAGEAETPTQVETALLRLFQRSCRQEFAGNPFSLGPALAYLFLLEMEVRDLILLIEAKSMGLTKDRYEAYLICAPGAKQERN